MIAYPFPPEGSATSYRTLRFVRQLSKIGWKTTVVSAVPSQYERYDPKLLAMVPSETEVIRVKGYDLWQAFQSWRFRRIQRKQSGNQTGRARARHDRQARNWRSWAREMVRTAEAWWYHPDVAMPWIRPAVKAAMDSVRSSAAERNLGECRTPISISHRATSFAANGCALRTRF